MKLGSLAAAVAVPLITLSARAQDPSACGARGAAVALRADVLEIPLRTRFTEQLRVALAARQIELCAPGDDGGHPIAGIALEATEDVRGAVVLAVTVSDELTNKRVVRDVDLRDVPPDSRALLLAQAADELLRASWAELLVAGAPAPTREVPRAVTEAVRPAERPPETTARAPHVETFAGLGAEVFGSGQTQAGLDLAIGVFPFERLGALFRAGVRSASATSTEAGDIDASALTFAVAVLGGVLPRTARLGIDVGPELFITRARYEGRAGPGARGRNEEASAVHLAAALRGWIGIIGPFRLAVALRGGAPLHDVRVVGREGTVAGVRGVLVGADLGIGGAW